MLITGRGAVKLDDPQYWAFRLRERLKDTSRIWSTEVGIAKASPSETIFGCRVICSQRGKTQTVPRSIPAFVRGLAFTQNCWLDGRRLSPEAWVVETEEELSEFQAFLHNTKRKQPVVAIALPHGSNNPADGALDTRSFIRRTVGFVHTVVLSSNMASELANRIGKELAVINRAVRTYNPGFDFSASLISEHPLATARAIEAWGDGREETFLDFLVQQTLRPVSSREELDESILIHSGQTRPMDKRADERKNQDKWMRRLSSFFRMKLPQPSSKPKRALISQYQRMKSESRRLQI